MGGKALSIGVFTIFTMFFVGCGTEDNVPTTTAQDSTEDIEGASLLKAGQMGGLGSYSVSGDVKLVLNEETETYSLVFENFSSSNGPDLKVYLSKGEVASPGQFLNLGDLKSTNGTLRYDFAASSFDPDFDYALIWCEQFGVNFGSGELLAP